MEKIIITRDTAFDFYANSKNNGEGQNQQAINHESTRQLNQLVALMAKMANKAVSYTVCENEYGNDDTSIEALKLTALKLARLEFDVSYEEVTTNTDEVEPDELPQETKKRGSSWGISGGYKSRSDRILKSIKSMHVLSVKQPNRVAPEALDTQIFKLPTISE